MSLWRQLAGGFRVLTNRTAADADVSDEVRDYLDRTIAAKVAGGLSPDEALRAARLELGNATAVREQVRSYGWENFAGTVAADLRYAARRLRATPGFTIVAVLTLALSIGATTAIFSGVSAILLAPLPYPHPDRLTAIRELRADGSASPGTFGMFRELTARNRAFDAMALVRTWQPAMTGAEQPERLEGQRVSAGYFHVLGITPIAGRDFQESDDRLNGPNVVILSDAFWRRHFAADRSIVGHVMTLDDASYEVIGIMPPGFENVLGPSAQLWAPLQYDLSQGRAWGHHLSTVGRLLPGVSIAQASLEVNAHGRAVLNEQHPETYDPNTTFAVASLRDDLTGGVKTTLLAIVGAVLLVLVIACVNVTNLLLARGVQRRGEFALRAALGAGRGRLVRQLLTESLLLAAIGGVAGVAVAALGVRALAAMSPPGLPRAATIGVDGTVFAIGFFVTTLIGVAFGVMPALQAARGDAKGDLQLESRRSIGNHRRLQGALVVSEVALALTLLVSSGLLLRSLERLFAVPMGFESQHLLTMQVQETGRRFVADSSRSRFFAQALDAVQRVNGVTAAAFTSQLPLSGDLDQYGASFEATPAREAQTYGSFRYAVSPGYLEMMHIPLKLGRLLDDRDRAGAPPVALISESLARLTFANESPLGKTLRVGGAPDAPPYTIVGVVGDVKQQSLALAASEAVYVTTTQWHWVDNVMSLVVRARGDAAALGPSVRNAIWSVDKDQPVVRVATMDQLLTASAAERRFALMLFEAFAFVALMLAAAGIYGVLSGSVVERTREIGVRAAMGASRPMIIAMIARQGFQLIAIGTVIGLAGVAVASRAIVSMLFGVSRLDPVTYAGVVVLLAVVSAVACAVPAWRAARVDPAITLRAE
jgi:putative ABC transport system permease protein